jgi:hypothetical protein
MVRFPPSLLSVTNVRGPCSLYILSSLLLLVILCHNCAILPVQKISNLVALRISGGYDDVVSRWQSLVQDVHHASFSKTGAWCLLVSFLAAFVTFIAANEDIM